MSVVPGPASQDAVIKRVLASPGLQCIYNEDFLFKRILIVIILYVGKGDFLKEANFAPEWPFYKK